jgi:glycosyltransferase involved in cell wall biosynthesis
MEKYHFNILINKQYHNAGTKAVADAKDILLKNGYLNIEISFIKSLYLMPYNLLKLTFKLTKYFLAIKPASLVVVQYPLLGINKYFSKYIKFLNKKGCKVACIIHDIDSIRSKDNASKIKKEINTLLAYDAVIAHNVSMSKWLRDNGYLGEIIVLELFDYLSSGKTVVNNTNLADVVFAGNLGRCVFLKDINKIKAPAINLYGPGLNTEVINNSLNIKWLGSFSPEQIINELSGKFGLVWDGVSINESTGLMGDYMRFNSPHKVSLYLACGMPVIVPESAAIAPIILNKGIGFTVNNLTELQQKISEISENEYLEMKTKAEAVGALLRTGNSLEQALKQLELLDMPK